MSFLQSRLSDSGVLEEFNWALTVSSDGPGVDEFLQSLDDFAFGGHPVVGRFVVVDAQESTGLAKVPSADGEGANVE